MLTIDEARAAMEGAFAPLPTERVSLLDAAGRFLAADLRVRRHAPAFDNSAMDGYAVRAAELATVPVTLPKHGESRAGGPAPGALPEGHVMRIFTGAPMPSGADAVVVQEDTEDEGASVLLRFAPDPGHHVRVAGEDLREGDVLLRSGCALHPGALALLASQGVAVVPVNRRPHVAILVTGDELRDLGEDLPPGAIVDSNAYALAALVAEAGGVPRILPRGGDDLDALTQSVRAGLEADLLLTTGGVSVGKYDLVRDALSRAGVEMQFWKVALKPGKPLAFGTFGSTAVLGLPGNPVSAFVTFHVFARPGIRRLLGDPTPEEVSLPVILGAPLRHRPGRRELVRARLRREGDRLVAYPHPKQGSGSLPSLAEADALVAIPSDREAVPAGELLEAMILRWPGH